VDGDGHGHRRADGGGARRTVRWDGPGLDAWRPWTPAEAAARLEGVAATWCVVGGWSIDLGVGRRTRAHADLEIATVRSDLPAIRAHLHPHVLHSVGDGHVERLAPDRSGPPDRHQHWVLDEQAGAWRLDVMAEPGDAVTWVFRRDPVVRAPRSAMVGVTEDEIPYLRPHGTLLFKAKRTSEKDDADFAVALPSMSEAERGWLARTLAAVHPDHAWIERLSRGT
jgi:Aminoglycoside-2''-adenylyltransferase